MDPISTVIDLDPSHLFRGNFGFSRGLENNVWEAKYHIAIYLEIGVTIQQKALNKSEQEDEDAIFREWNHSIRGMCQKSVTELHI